VLCDAQAWLPLLSMVTQPFKLLSGAAAKHTKMAGVGVLIVCVDQAAAVADYALETTARATCKEVCNHMCLQSGGHLPS